MDYVTSLPLGVSHHTHTTNKTLFISHVWYYIASRCVYTRTLLWCSHTGSKHRTHNLKSKRLFTWMRQKKLFDLYAHRMKNSQLNSAYRRINMLNMFIHSNEFAIIVASYWTAPLPLSLSLPHSFHELLRRSCASRCISKCEAKRRARVTFFWSLLYLKLDSQNDLHLIS